jgi:hypothetical protein
VPPTEDDDDNDKSLSNVRTSSSPLPDAEQQTQPFFRTKTPPLFPLLAVLLLLLLLLDDAGANSE